MCPFNIRKKKTSPLLPTSLITLCTHARFSYIQSRACQDSGEVLGLCSEWLSAERKEKKRKQQPGAPQADMSSLLLANTCFLNKPRHGCVGLLSPPVEPRNCRTWVLRGRGSSQSVCSGRARATSWQVTRVQLRATARQVFGGKTWLWFPGPIL